MTRTRAGGRRRDRDRFRCRGVADDAGQATVELALVLPFVMLLALGVVQVGGIVHDQVQVTAAAREAARAAAVSDDPASSTRAAHAGGGLATERLRVTVERGPPPMVAATVTYRVTTDVPLIGAVLPDVDLRAEATMRDETT